MVRVQKLGLFLPCDATRYSAVFAVVRCPSVCPSCSCIVTRRLKISSNIFLGRVVPWF